MNLGLLPYMLHFIAIVTIPPRFQNPQSFPPPPLVSAHVPSVPTKISAQVPLLYTTYPVEKVPEPGAILY